MKNPDGERVGTDPYKGVRDFYPQDQAIQNYIFSVWRNAAERFGYAEYGASILEPSELYRNKTSEEIVSEQTYAFTDRGGREVTLRPEMTPSAARMIAAKRKELPFPLRWYSIPNVFRYERPQRGRLREHWQLNADVFGLPGLEAETEIISLAHEMLLAFGAKEADFEIRLNSRSALAAWMEQAGVPPEKETAAMRLLDRKDKMPEAEFREKSAGLFGRAIGVRFNPDEKTESLLGSLKRRGIANARFDERIIRGFDYYTGIVFEVFDTNPKNSRSLFGGGRYDNLLDLFGAEKVPAVGFGAGDVTIRDFLELRGLLPAYRPKAVLCLCVMNEAVVPFSDDLAAKLRSDNLAVAVDYTGRKTGDQIRAADRQKIPFIICIGENERAARVFKVKELSSGVETPVAEADLPAFLKNAGGRGAVSKQP